jgi:hypothetical protein
VRRALPAEILSKYEQRQAEDALLEQSFLGWSDIYIKCIIYSVWLIEVMDFALFGFGV